ncbi:MAG: transcriptional regulator [Candidatus Latescibacteria bacterium]|nr:transcriptional regulator [Candidatus Latescibacterota bacterium]
MIKNDIHTCVTETLKVWPEVTRIVSTLHTEDQYNTAVTLLDELIDQVNINEDVNIESLIDTLGTLIKDYEDRNVPEPDTDPGGNLKYLMREHHVKQSDLPEIGSQGVLSEILSGKRKLNVRQIRLLSKRFHVSPAVFI